MPALPVFLCPWMEGMQQGAMDGGVAMPMDELCDPPYLIGINFCIGCAVGIHTLFT